MGRSEAELRVGDAPFILLSTIKEVIDTLAENEHVAGVSQEMVFHEWSTNLDYYKSHVVYPPTRARCPAKANLPAG